MTEARFPQPLWDVIEAAAIKRMAVAWHDVSDHAKDGSRFGGSFFCNCERIAERAYLLGWREDD